MHNNFTLKRTSTAGQIAIDESTYTRKYIIGHRSIICRFPYSLSLLCQTPRFPYVGQLYYPRTLTMEKMDYFFFILVILGLSLFYVIYSEPNILLTMRRANR